MLESRYQALKLKLFGLVPSPLQIRTTLNFFPSVKLGKSFAKALKLQALTMKDLKLTLKLKSKRGVRFGIEWEIWVG